MNFSFSKSQKILQKSANDFLKKECQEMAREAETAPDGFFPEAYLKIADLGWLGVGIPEEYEGIGGDFVEIVILLEEMGKHLFPSPFISCLLCAGYLINEFGTEEQKKALLPELVSGECIIVPATIRPEPAFGHIEVEDCLTENPDGFEVSGTRLFVPFAKKANWFLTYASDKNGDQRFYLVSKQEAKITQLETIAADKQCEVIFEKIKIPLSSVLGEVTDFEKMLAKMNLFGSLGESAYLLGILEKVLEMTIGYAKQRKQFGKFIGQFQAIQHQCADMAMAVEQLRLLTYHAAWKISNGLDAKKDVAMAKAKASQAARQVPLRGITVHGGIGIIDEYDLQLYFRRAKAKEVSFGDADYHRELVAEAMGL